MQKAKNFQLKGSNIENLGGAMDKAAREGAAASEDAWKGAGQAVGTEIWRIENFAVKAWPKEEYGKFFVGDSYIVLYTYKKPKKNPLYHDIHFWLGSETTQDEAGTAAYKTVELDDLMGGEPVQYREVEGFESEKFQSLFPFIQLLTGGVESGFKHVKPEEYKARLLHIKGKRHCKVMQVPLTVDSINDGDCFIMDMGLKVYQMNGGKSGIFEKQKAAEIARALDDERGSAVDIEVITPREACEPFWKALGSKSGKPMKIKSAQEGGSDIEAEKGADKTIYQLSDESGKMEFTQVQKAKKIDRKKLNTKDVFIVDAGHEVFVWVGLGASKEERRKGIIYAQEYLIKNNRPAYLPITRVMEGGENEAFEQIFS